MIMALEDRIRLVVDIEFRMVIIERCMATLVGSV